MLANTLTCEETTDVYIYIYIYIDSTGERTYENIHASSNNETEICFKLLIHVVPVCCVVSHSDTRKHGYHFLGLSV